MRTPIPAIVAALVLTACASTKPQPQQSPVVEVASSNEPVFLWSMASADGSLAGPDDQNLRLTMTGVDEFVTRFTDRPDRTATAVDTRDFFERWEQRFASIPPNAVLSYSLGSGQAPTQIVVTLTNPEYDPEAQTLSFDAQRIRRQADDLPDTDYTVQLPAIDNPSDTGPLAVFIDTQGATTDAACTPTIMVVRHAEDESNPQGGPDILSAVGKKHAALYPELFDKYLATEHGVGPGGADAAVCPIGKILAIDPKPNAQNNSPGTNPYQTIKPLAQALGLPIQIKDAEGVSYSTVYDWNAARRSTLLDNTSPTSTVIAWDKQGLNPSADDLRNKSINGKKLGEYDFVPLLQALPSTPTAIIGTAGEYTPQRTDFYVFAQQDPGNGTFAYAKARKQYFSDDSGVTWYYRTALASQDNPNDIKV
jgi:hypothetical protein